MGVEEGDRAFLGSIRTTLTDVGKALEEGEEANDHFGA